LPKIASFLALDLIIVDFFDAAVTKLKVKQPVDRDDQRPQIPALRSCDHKKIAGEVPTSVHVPTAVSAGHGLGLIQTVKPPARPSPI
jgi:hypothetical protein